MAVTNRKVLQLAGSTLEKIKTLSGDDAIQARELLIATDTNQIILGKSDGTFVALGSVTRGTTEEREAATPSDGQLFFDTTEKALYIGDGTQWESAGGQFDHSNFIEKVADATAENLVKFGADGSIADSGFKIDDTESTDKTIWSAAKITEVVTDSINGLSWQRPVKSVVDALPTADLTKGDRYLILSETDAQKDTIVEYNGTAWVATNPVDGMAVFVEDTDKQMSYNGTEWVDISAALQYSGSNTIDITEKTLSVKVKENGGLVATIDGLAANIDEVTLVMNEDGKIVVGDLDFGTF